MKIITNGTELAQLLESPFAPAIKTLLATRREQLLQETVGEYDIGELAHWVIVDQGDALPAIEAAANYPIAPHPPWEWVLDHGGIFEAPIILSDDGFGVVLIVPDEPGIDPILSAMLRRDAQRARDIES